MGSYGRGTAIEGFSDLDMVFELPGALYKRYDDYIGNGQSALLRGVQESSGGAEEAGGHDIFRC